MKTMHFWTVAGVVLLLAANAKGRAAYKGIVQMIKTADVIAIVEITQVERVSVKGKHWTYGQKASAKVEKAFKGKLSGSVFLYGDEDFICASCHFETGRYLVFLDRDDALLTGNNWHLSVRKITGDSNEKVEWFDDGQKSIEKVALLSEVQRDIEAVLKTSKQSRP